MNSVNEPLFRSLRSFVAIICEGSFEHEATREETKFQSFCFLCSFRFLLFKIPAFFISFAGKFLRRTQADVPALARLALLFDNRSDH